MGKLIYATPASLDGYIADENGDFTWSTPDAEGFAFITDLLRPAGAYLYGRKLYETMAVWQTPEVIPGLTPEMREFGRIWQAADKIVYSKTLRGVSTPKTRLEREFDAAAVRDLKASSTRDLWVGGAAMAGQAIRAGLVDEYHLFVSPILVGGGKRVFPDNVRVRLELRDERHFANGLVCLHYQTRA